MPTEGVIILPVNNLKSGRVMEKDFFAVFCHRHIFCAISFHKSCRIAADVVCKRDKEEYTTASNSYPSNIAPIG